MLGKITDIQKFSLHDGPGIRTTVFFKGCNMSCVWCHNPESISNKKEIMFYATKCILCKKCYFYCPTGALKLIRELDHSYDRNKCIHCGKCVNICPAKALTYGSREIDSDYIVKAVVADKKYYDKSRGGLTVSGGEPLMQSDFAKDILQKCQKEGIDTAIETNLSLPKETIDKVLPYLNRIYCDLKIFDEEMHIKYTGITNKTILKNIAYVASKKIPMTIRTPIIPTITDSKENIENISEWIKTNAPNANYELLNYNPFAESKFNELGLAFPLKGKKPKSDVEMETYYNIAKEKGINVIY